MNNEEKILELLVAMQSDISELKTTQAKQGEQIAEMQETLTRVAVTQEGQVLPRIQLLFEGQKNLLDTLAPKDRMEVLEDEVITLKTVVKSMSKRLAALEKAQ